MTAATDTPTPSTKRTRRRRKRGNEPSQAVPLGTACSREGCRGSVTRPGLVHCTVVCRELANSLDKAQRTAAVFGQDAPLVAELVAQVVAANEAYTRFKDLDRRLFREARSVGITVEQWQAIREGG